MPRREIADLLDVDVPPGGMVITVSDLHLPPIRTDVSGRSCETLARRLDDQAGPLTVVLAGDLQLALARVVGSPLDGALHLIGRMGDSGEPRMLAGLALLSARH